MDRRAFVIGLGAILAAPFAAEAQQGPKVWRIGMLVVASRLDPAEAMNIAALRDGLRAAGYVDGRNVVIDYRWAEGRLERLNGLADELVGGKPDVIVAISEPAAVAARHATTTIPIVMPICGDPVAAGLASSLSRPGGNVTGLAQLKPEMTPKVPRAVTGDRP